jgi:hypothetical protein
MPAAVIDHGGGKARRRGMVMSQAGEIATMSRRESAQSGRIEPTAQGSRVFIPVAIVSREERKCHGSMHAPKLYASFWKIRNMESMNFSANTVGINETFKSCWRTLKPAFRAIIALIIFDLRYVIMIVIFLDPLL